MAKAFSVVSWNVEHFGAVGKNKKPKEPVKPVFEYSATKGINLVITRF